MNRMHVRGVGLALLVAVGACGDSATDVVTDELSEAEAAALAEVMSENVFATWQQDQGQAAMAPSLATFERSVQLEASCELSGSVSVSGDVVMETSETSEDVTIDYTVTQVHQSCVGESEDGVRFTLDGAPDVTANFTVEAGEDLVTLDGGYAGSVDWSTDDKQGTCSVDVTFTAEVSQAGQSGSVTMSGSVCGVSFSDSVSFSA
ncbi:MAG: hypothetical protein U5R14_01305 [Gemmatimonadota bacterium]|nr:hypothetical protein [Gemmatimonadota bacterium]